jgi:hypothetical protein
MRRGSLIALALATLLVTAISAQQDRKGQTTLLPGGGKIETTAPERHTGQAVNVRIDLTITEQREGLAPTPKTITMMIADRDRGQIRSGGSNEQMLNVDAHPEIVQNGRVRVYLTFDYRAPRTDTDKAPPMLTQSLSSILDDGKPLMISQWTEAGSSRTVKVELTADVQK